MTLQDLKNQLNQAKFSEEITSKLNAILDQAILQNNLSQEDKQKMLDIINLDIEAGNLEADTLENLSLALNSYANEIEHINKQSQVEEEKILSDAEEEINELEKETDQADQKIDEVRQQLDDLTPLE